MPTLPAARVGDDIAHSNAGTGMLLGVLAGVAVGAVLVGATIATGGAALVLATGAAMGAVSAGGLGGMYIGEASMGPACGKFTTGSPNVFVNGRPATFTLGSTAACSKDGGAPIPLATGAAKVVVNFGLAGRETEKVGCSAKSIAKTSPNVFIGGPSAQDPRVEISPEVPGWAVTGLQVLGVAGALIALPAAIMTVGVAATIGGGVLGLVGGIAGAAGGRALGEALGLSEAGIRTLETAGGLLGGMVGGAAGARGALRGRVAYDRHRITSLSKADRLDDARAILQPHVDRGDTRAIIDRLDVSTDRSRGFLWSGNKEAAGQYAGLRGGRTLEQTPGGRVIDEWPELNSKLPWDKGGEQLWGGVSRKYAQGLSGDVVAVQSPSKAGGGYVFKNYELPEIRRGLLSGRITSFEERVVLPEPGGSP